MRIFRAHRHYDPALDVREYGDLLERMKGEPPAGAAWLMVFAPRGRRTWTLRGVVHRLRAGQASYVDLRKDPLPKKSAPGPGGCLLIDEPLPRLERPENAQRFLVECAELHRRGVRVVVGVTPLELSLLEKADHAGRVVSRDAALSLPPFSLEEARRQASRAPAAQAVLEVLPPLWRRSPYLLELIFSTLEVDPDLGGSPGELLRAVIERCERTTRPGREYFESVFFGGLTDKHREIVRAVAQRGSSPASLERDLLSATGLIEREGEGDRCRLLDPLLEHHLALPCAPGG